MAKSKPKKAAAQEEAPPGVPEWVVTYGDMMSLLLTFFIMLVSLSEMKQDGQLRAMLDALQERFGSTASMNSGVPGTSLQENSFYSEMRSSGNRSEDGLKKRSKDAGGQVGKFDTVERINQGTVVTIGGPTMFDPFTADLNEQITENLDILADIIKQRPNLICIRGHASPEPLPFDSPYADQFALSFARAEAVARYFIEVKQIPPTRMIVSAAGETEPRLLTRDSQTLMNNHRVDVFLIDAYIKR